MSDAMHETASPVAALRRRPAVDGGVWQTLPVGESRSQQVRRQLRMLQVQRAAFGIRVA